MSNVINDQVSPTSTRGPDKRRGQDRVGLWQLNLPILGLRCVCCHSFPPPLPRDDGDLSFSRSSLMLVHASVCTSMTPEVHLAPISDVKINRKV